MQAERIARNTPIQGSAADILKLAMVAIDRRLREEAWPAIMVCTVHDELVFEVEPGEAERLAQMVKGEMEGAGRQAGISVHLRVDVGHGPSWADAH
jgi:DNA polymerase-1